MGDENSWDVDYETGRANSSPMFTHIVDAVARMVGDARLGEDPRSVAVVIVAQLAHVHGMAPAHPATKTNCAVCSSFRRVSAKDGVAALSCRPGEYVVRESSSGSGDFTASVMWLREHWSEFAGQWVALLGGVLVDKDTSRSILQERIASKPFLRDLLVTRVGPWLEGKT